MQQDVITDVNSQVTNNVVVEDAQYGSDIVAIKMNDKFIAELHISKQRQKKQRMMENRARDNSLMKAMLRSNRRDWGESEEDGPDDETQPTLDSQLQFFYETCCNLMTLCADDCCNLICSKQFCDGLFLAYIIRTCMGMTYLWIIR